MLSSTSSSPKPAVSNLFFPQAKFRLKVSLGARSTGGGGRVRVGSAGVNIDVIHPPLPLKTCMFTQALSLGMQQQALLAPTLNSWDSTSSASWVK